MSLKSLLKSAHESYLQQDYAHAIHLCQLGLDFEPENYNLLCLKAHSMFIQGKATLEAVLQVYDHAVRSKPSLPQAHQGVLRVLEDEKTPHSVEWKRRIESTYESLDKIYSKENMADKRLEIYTKFRNHCFEFGLFEKLSLLDRERADALCYTGTDDCPGMKIELDSHFECHPDSIRIVDHLQDAIQKQDKEKYTKEVERRRFGLGAKKSILDVSLLVSATVAHESLLNDLFQWLSRRHPAQFTSQRRTMYFDLLFAQLPVLQMVDAQKKDVVLDQLRTTSEGLMDRCGSAIMFRVESSDFEGAIEILHSVDLGIDCELKTYLAALHVVLDTLPADCDLGQREMFAKVMHVPIGRVENMLMVAREGNSVILHFYCSLRYFMENDFCQCLINVSESIAYLHRNNRLYGRSFIQYECLLSYIEGMSHHMQGDNDAAVKSLESFMESATQSASLGNLALTNTIISACSSLVGVFIGTSDLGRALFYAKKCSDLGNIFGHCDAAWIYFLQRNIDMAHREISVMFNSPLEQLMNSQLSTALYRRGRILHARDRTGSVGPREFELDAGSNNAKFALTDIFGKAIKADPLNYRALIFYALLRERSSENPEKSAGLFESAFNLCPSDALGAVCYAKALLQNNEHSKLSLLDISVESLINETDNFAESPKIFSIISYFKAVSHYHVGKYPESIFALQRAIKFDKNNQMFWILLSMCYDRVGRWGSAVKAIQKAIDLKLQAAGGHGLERDACHCPIADDLDLEFTSPVETLYILQCRYQVRLCAYDAALALIDNKLASSSTDPVVVRLLFDCRFGNIRSALRSGDFGSSLLNIKLCRDMICNGFQVPSEYVEFMSKLEALSRAELKNE